MESTWYCQQGQQLSEVSQGILRWLKSSQHDKSAGNGPIYSPKNSITWEFWMVRLGITKSLLLTITLRSTWGVTPCAGWRCISPMLCHQLPWLMMLRRSIVRGLDEGTYLLQITCVKKMLCPLFSRSLVMMGLIRSQSSIVEGTS